MLMTVLKGELATKQSIALVGLFKQMKQYLQDNAGSQISLEVSSTVLLSYPGLLLLLSSTSDSHRS